MTYSNASEGTYAFTAKAYDDVGAVTVSAPTTVTVHPNQPPIASLSSPANAGPAPATISLQATASDSDGTINRVPNYHPKPRPTTSTKPATQSTADVK